MDFSTESPPVNRRSLPLGPRGLIAVAALAVVLVGSALILIPRLGGGPSSEEVVAAFEEQGLEVGETFEVPTENYGPVPEAYEEGTRFEIPSLGADSGGRVFTGPADEVEDVAQYYRAFGSPQSVVGSWVFVNEGVVVQINGELPEGEARQYQEVVRLLE